MADFEYIRSRGAHGYHVHGSFDAFVGSDREIWVGDDGSGLIRESSGPVAFFTEDGRVRWRVAGSPELERSPGVDLFAPGCLGAGRLRRARLEGDRDSLTAVVTRGPKTLHNVQELLGEAVVDPGFCQTVYGLACQLPDVAEVSALSDQLGRVGRGLVGTQDGERGELIFAEDCGELLGYQWFLAEPRPFAPVGALHLWCSFLERAIVDRLPPEVPPIPRLPCEPPGAGSAVRIRPGFIVSTGYVGDPLTQLARLHDQGVISDSDYDIATADAGVGN